LTKAWGIDITAKSITIGQSGGEKHFYLQSEEPWTITSEEDWISISPASGAGSAQKITVTVTIQAGGVSSGSLTINSGRVSFAIPVSRVDTNDYWHDGELLTTFESPGLPEGLKPIAIVMIGDGWDLSDLKHDGFFERYAKAWTDWFFKFDVVKDMQEYFNVYAYFAESEQRGINGFTKFGTLAGVAGPDRDRMAEVATLAIQKVYPQVSEIVFVNMANGAIGGWNFGAYNPALPNSHCQFVDYSNPEMEQTGYPWFNHECIGHNVAHMPDFYYISRTLNWNGGMESYTYPFRSGQRPKYCTDGNEVGSNVYDWLYDEWDRGYYWMCDYETNPQKVLWHSFIGKTGYDSVGVYSGQTLGAAQITGFYQPELGNNMMNNHYSQPDVGTRFWVWSKILERAGVTTSPCLLSNPNPAHPRSLQNFMLWDSIHQYNDNGAFINPTGCPEILTATYWHQHAIFPIDFWLPRATFVINLTARSVVVKWNDKVLTKNTDYTLQNSTDGNYAIIKGMGKYSGTVKIRFSNNVIYNGNGNTGGRFPTDTSYYAPGQEIKILFSPIPERDGATFAGWANSPGATVANYTNTGTTHRVMPDSGDVILYAVWVTDGMLVNNPTWTIVTNGSAYDSNIGMAMDGDLGTRWHSVPPHWNTDDYSKSFPHYIVVDMQKTTTVESLTIIPPPSENGNWTDIKVFLTNSTIIMNEASLPEVDAAHGGFPSAWGTPVVSQNNVPSNTPAIYRFEPTIEGRYMVVAFIYSVDGANPHVKVAELQIYHYEGPEVKVTGLSLSDSLLVKHPSSAPAQLTAYIQPANASNQMVKWTVADTSIATVNSYGQVNFKNAGETIVVATTLEGNISDTCYIIVDQNIIDNINVINNPKIRVYPNPVRNQLQISNYGARIDDTIAIYNANGQQIANTQFSILNTNTIDVSRLAAGIYVLRLGNSSVKFIKE
jgi:hypothetical protein